MELLKMFDIELLMLEAVIILAITQKIKDSLKNLNVDEKYISFVWIIAVMLSFPIVSLIHGVPLFSITSQIATEAIVVGMISTGSFSIAKEMIGNLGNNDLKLTKK